MTIADFVGYNNVPHRLTVDFVRAVPTTSGTSRRIPPESSAATRHPFELATGSRLFASSSGTLCVCVESTTVRCQPGRFDWTRKHDHYYGPLTRDPLLAAMDQKQQQLLTILENIDNVGLTIDWGGTPFNFASFTWEFLQHEAIDHGQWSIYASLAGFDTPSSWRASWGL